MWRLTRPDATAILDDPKVKMSLPRYVDVVRGRRLAKFIIARSMATEFDAEDSTGDLWQLHGGLLERYGELERGLDEESSKLEDLDGDLSFLDLKVELGRRVMASCHFCVRRCGADRLEGELLSELLWIVDSASVDYYGRLCGLDAVFGWELRARACYEDVATGCARR